MLLLFIIRNIFLIHVYTYSIIKVICTDDLAHYLVLFLNSITFLEKLLPDFI